jgi:MSHA biogenesis protein MshJ
MSALNKRYEALSLRERALVVLALLGLLIVCWDTLLMEPLRRARLGFESELANAGSFGSVGDVDVSDPRQVNIKRAGEMQTQLAGIDAQLTSTARGFVSADRMIEVLHDMLDRQGRLDLVSIRNLPVTSLVLAPEAGAEAQPPYVHSIELVIDGQYGDILDYLAALEKLPWKFRWTSLDLSTAGYPRNRVRIELATLSLDSTWLGV